MTFSQAVQSKVHEESLGDFPVAAFLKFLLRDPVVERRYYAGELPHDLLTNLYDSLGGTPRFLGQIIEVLKIIMAHDLWSELAAVKLPAGVESSVLREARDRYCEQIFTARLYGHLSPISQRALSRAAVYMIAVNLAGLAAVTGEPVERLREFTQEWQAYALAYPERERVAGELWTVYGLLRAWLLAPERLSLDERRVANRAAGDFLSDLGRQGRESQLGLTRLDCLLEARSQYLLAGDFPQAREVTDWISGFWVVQGLYDELRRLNEEVLEHAKHPTPMGWIGRAYFELGDYPTARKWYQCCLAAAGETMLKEASNAWYHLASIDGRQGEYGPAREKFQKALEIEQQVGFRRAEAVTWHALGTIDGEQGEYGPAREKFQKALEILQQGGDRGGEAGIWHQLGDLDVKQDELEAAREKFQKALEIRQETGQRADEADTWHGLATVDAYQGHYGAAREKFHRALEIEQQVGDLEGEAANWLGLATVDMFQNDFGPAREKFQKALEIEQQIGNRRAEGSIYSRLGQLAILIGRTEAGLLLLALSAVLFQDIGHADIKHTEQLIHVIASQLNYTQDQLKKLRGQAAEVYRKDRGWGLVEEAFRGLK